jgi:16S rRNA (guanine527-N7)-methyltransferase
VKHFPIASLFFKISKETFRKLYVYQEMLEGWNAVSGLMSGQECLKQTLWHRHFLDSLQIMPWLSGESWILDLGSGGGLPGIVLAIGGAQRLVLVEKKFKKIMFLKNVVRCLDLPAEVFPGAIERFVSSKRWTIVSRATASVENILDMVGHLEVEKYVLLKGKKWQEEMTKAQKRFLMDWIAIPSITEKDGKIIIMKNVRSR